MSLIGRYIFRQIVFALLLTLTTLVVLLWFSQALTQVRLVMSQGQTFWLFVQVTTLALPALISVIGPVAMVIAIIHVLNRLNSDSELVVVTAAGAPRMQLVAPVMTVAFIVMIATAAISLYLQPIAAKQFRAVMTQVKADVIASMAQEGQFTRLNAMTLHIQSRGPDGTLNGLMVHDMSDPANISTYLAERGRIIEENGGSYLVMERGSLQRAGQTPESITMVGFDRYVYDLNHFADARDVAIYHSRERSTLELLFPDTSEAYYQENEGRFRSELHERVSSMLYPIAFAAIALAMVGFARTSRESRTSLVLIAVVWIVGLRILGFAVANLARQAVWPVFLMYALPLSAIALALAIAFGYTRGLEAIALHYWNLIPREAIARRTGLRWLADTMRPALRSLMRQSGFAS
ncbi:LPS export ABC transporter permease LptF [Tepidamorphus sp. 3E244]|uniref:LPS export ABC transporter permease LptF n=1 Tax=Tepidamorphus sp. 3E244 TaxID=3385498 RepID=UPI0038FCCC96